MLMNKKWFYEKEDRNLITAVSTTKTKIGVLLMILDPFIDRLSVFLPRPADPPYILWITSPSHLPRLIISRLIRLEGYHSQGE